MPDRFDAPPPPGRVVPITTYYAIASSGDVVGRFEVIQVCAGRWSVHDDLLGNKVVGGLTRSEAVAWAKEEAWFAVQYAEETASRRSRATDRPRTETKGQREAT